MLLNQESFDAIVTAVHPSRAAMAISDGGGQRRSPRVPIMTRLTMIPYAAGSESLAGYDFPLDDAGSLSIPLADPVSVPIRDLSRGGVRFMMPRRLPLDTPFVLLLPPVPSLRAERIDSPTAVECTVTYWQPVRKDLFAIGAQFVRMLSPFAIPAEPPTIVLPGFGAVGSTLETDLREVV